MRLQYRPGDRSKVCSHFTLIRHALFIPHEPTEEQVFFSCFLGGGKKTPCVTQDFFLVITKHGGLYKSLAMALTIGQLGRVSPVYNLQFCPSLFPAGEGRVSRLLNSWQITGQRGVSSDSRKHGERRWQVIAADQEGSYRAIIYVQICVSLRVTSLFFSPCSLPSASFHSRFLFSLTHSSFCSGYRRETWSREERRERLLVRYINFIRWYINAVFTTCSAAHKAKENLSLLL